MDTTEGSTHTSADVVQLQSQYEGFEASKTATPPAEALVKVEEPATKKLKVEEQEELAHQEIPKFDLPPVHEMVGGSSVRKYLNENLTPHLLEGLKIVGKNKPEDPLYELAQFLLQRSAELKGAHNS